MIISSKNIIIIDNAPIPFAITQYFSQLNIHIKHSHELKTELFHETNPIAVLINWEIIHDNLAKKLKEYTAIFHAPLIILSDTKQEELSILILEAGADEFMTKPINPRELHARITAINRQIIKSTQRKANSKDYIAFDEWLLYPASRQLFNKKQEELKLSTNEYNLLLTFLKQPHQVLGRNFLLQITKNSELKVMDRRIDIQISRLRQKIEPGSQKPKLIKTVRNMGYIFTAQVFCNKKSQ